MLWAKTSDAGRDAIAEAVFERIDVLGVTDCPFMLTVGARRRRKPTILACLHQTANARATAIDERTYANRAGSTGPSATAYIDHEVWSWGVPASEATRAQQRR